MPTDSLLRHLQSLTEFDLTNRILIPLLKALGYERVQYFGGTDEEGKDIVCWRRNEIGDIELTVAQVKKFKLSRKSSSDRSIHTVINQLSQAIEKKLPSIDGCLYRPEIVYFITPYPLDTKVIDARFEAYENLRARRIRIIDGPRIISLVRDKLPNLFNEIAGPLAQVSSVISSELNNKTLINALEYTTYRSITERQGVETFYTDIDFSLIRPSARLLFSSELIGSVRTSLLSGDDCTPFLNLNEISLRIFGCGFIKDPDLLADKLRQHKERHAQWEASHAPLTESYLNSLKLRDDMEKKIKDKHLENAIVSALMTNDYISAGTGVLAAERLGVRNQAINPEVIDKNVTALSKEYAETLACLGKAESVYYFSANSKRPRLDAPVVIDGLKLAEVLSERRAKIEDTIETFNHQKPSTDELRDFLIGCAEFFDASERILQDSRVAGAVGIGSDRVPRTFSTRLEISVHDVFKTGINVALLGDAGAGKTTSLQMHAYKLINSVYGKKLVLYVPLAALARVWREKIQMPIEKAGTPLLEEGLHLYLQSLGFLGERSDLAQELQHNGGTLLLDGVDEVFKSLPWIVDSILSFSERLDLVQIIVSARSTGNYLDSLSFVNIALLPFTDDQRSRFIRKWFDERDESLVRRILEHLASTPYVAEIIKNPLLATILCVLAENDVPLPTSEVRLYDERLRLLLGHYDLHKRVRRSETPSSNLSLVARKLAYLLHFREKRDEELEQLYEMAKASGLPPDQCRRAVDELIDPCNVLVPTEEGGRYSFGHLRYQEHLAAQEIASNRAIPIVPLMEQERWTEVFVLYIQMNQDVKSIVQRIARAGKVSSVIRTLLRMVEPLSQGQQSYSDKPFGTETIFDDPFDPRNNS